MSSTTDQFVGTRPVSGAHAFDVGALSAWLERHLEGFAGPLSVEMFKGGQSNPTYKLITPARSYVMRAKPGPVAKLLPSAHAIEREFAVMTGLAGTDVPVARMHALCEDESVIGRAFYVMECVEGRVLWEQSLPGLSPPERGAIYDEMNRVIAALLKLSDPNIATLDHLGLAPHSNVVEQDGDVLRSPVLAVLVGCGHHHDRILAEPRPPTQVRPSRKTDRTTKPSYPACVC